MENGEVRDTIQARAKHSGTDLIPVMDNNVINMPTEKMIYGSQILECILFLLMAYTGRYFIDKKQVKRSRSNSQSIANCSSVDAILEISFGTLSFLTNQPIIIFTNSVSFIRRILVLIPLRQTQ